jgi:hypothetical protein
MQGPLSFPRLLLKSLAIAALGVGLMLGVYYVNQARAGTGLGVTPEFPTTVAVGDTGVAASLTIANNSTADEGTVTISDISLIPSCGNFTTTCTAPDPDVFSLSATGTGHTGTSCAGDTFTIAETDATTGKVSFTRTGGSLTLAFGASCTIDFTIDVLKSPTLDALAAAGTQTAQRGAATGLSALGHPADGTGSDSTTVTKASPQISTTPSAGGPVGTVLNDTATLSGGNSPTGTVTFKLFPPSDSTCSGTPVFTEADASSPYATTTGYTSIVAGTYRWTADYAGDSNNNAVSSGCQDEQVVVTQGAPSISTTPNPASGEVGDVLNDTATLSGGSSPTGNVTFKLFPPSDTTCSGVPVFTEVDASAPYATTTGYTSLVAGTYRWTADYAGDANNAAVSSGCQDEQVVITQPTSQGCSPGYWKQPQHFGSYPDGVFPNDLFTSVGFEDAFPNMSLLQVLSLKGGGLNALGRIIVAAYLNASTIDGFAFTPQQVIDDFNAAFPGGDFNALKAKYEALQDPCPLGNNPGPAGPTTTASVASAQSTQEVVVTDQPQGSEADIVVTDQPSGKSNNGKALGKTK